MLAIFIQICFYFGITSGQIVTPSNGNITAQEHSTVTLQWEISLLPGEKVSNLKLYHKYYMEELYDPSTILYKPLWSQDGQNTFDDYRWKDMNFTISEPYFPNFIVRIDNVIAGFTQFALSGVINHTDSASTTFSYIPIHIGIIGNSLFT